MGRHHLARPAPGSPEIDQQGHFIPAEMLVECLRIEFDGLAREQRSVATTAVRLLRQSFLGDAIGGLAVIANKIHTSLLFWWYARIVSLPLNAWGGVGGIDIRSDLNAAFVASIYSSFYCVAPGVLDPH